MKRSKVGLKGLAFCHVWGDETGSIHGLRPFDLEGCETTLYGRARAEGKAWQRL